MHHVFQRFVEQLNDSHEPNKFRRAMAEAAAAFDLPCFAYLRMPRDGKSLAALISTYPPAWTEYYLAHHYERLDPVIRQVQTSLEPFEWGQERSSRPLSVSEKVFFDEARGFGISCGLTIPVKDSTGPVAAVTFATEKFSAAFKKTIDENRRALQLMSISLHSHVRRKLWQDKTFNGVTLSPRELECLRWAEQGKSAWDIGTILGISERTVVFHFENAKRKLNVRSLRQAVAILNART